MLSRKAIDNNKVKAILFDSGRVLNMSITGHWFITPNFFTYIDKKIFNSIPASMKELAFNSAGEYISKQNLIIDEDEEYKYFLEYYKIFSNCLPQLKLTNDDIQLITMDYVYNYSKYKFFDDAVNLIPELSKSYKLAVVSDAWPSLENVFRKADLRDYFSSFVISSKKGITKPNKSMYKTALNELNVLPEESIFIDDSIKNCNGAMQMGIDSFVLSRNWRDYAYNKMFNRNYKIIRSLKDIKWE